MDDSPGFVGLLRSIYRRHRHECQLLIAIFVVAAATALFDADHNYVSPDRSLESARFIVQQTSLLGIFALGAAIVIISGGIDLSSGSVIAFSATICTSVMLLLAPDEMINSRPVGDAVIAAAIGATILVGFLIGSLHAWLITVVKLPPFVATLATLVGLRSLARAIIESVNEQIRGNRISRIQVYDEFFRDFGRTYWVPAIIFLVLALLCWLMLSRTVVGRHLYALGGSEEAARLSGIRTDRLKWLAYCISAILSSIAGILLVGYEGEANPQAMGVGYELNAIAAAVVGGCSLSGGVGTIPGTVLGALFLQAVIDGINKIVKSGADIYQGLIVGVVVVFAVAFSQLESGVRGKKFFAGRLGLVAIVNLSAIAGALAALIGPRLLEGDTNLDGKYLFGFVAGGIGVFLLLIRSRLSASRRRQLGVAVAVVWIAAVLFVDRNLPAMRYRAAIRSVEQAGGRVEAVDDGTAVVFSNQQIGDESLRAVFDELRFITDLTELRLDGTELTDDGMQALAQELGRSRRPTLRRLDVRNTSVKKLGERHVEREIPRIKITR